MRKASHITGTVIYDGKKYRVRVQVEKYECNGRMAVSLLLRGESYWYISVNCPEVKIACDEFIFKTYSENEGLFEQLVSQGIVEPTGQHAGVQGYHCMNLPICRLRK